MHERLSLDFYGPVIRLSFIRREFEHFPVQIMTMSQGVFCVSYLSPLCLLRFLHEEDDEEFFTLYSQLELRAGTIG